MEDAPQHVAKRPKKIRNCASCRQDLCLTYFSKTQRRHGQTAKCKSCVAAAILPKTKKPNKLLCGVCGENQYRNKFSKVELANDNRKCYDCFWKDPRECSVCHEKKEEHQYSKGQWGLGHDRTDGACRPSIDCASRKCLECFPIEQEEWPIAKKECLAARDAGYQHYVLPDPTTIDFSNLPATTASLIGTYDIVFQTQSGQSCYSDLSYPAPRTAKGTLKLETDSNGKLVGSIVRVHPPCLPRYDDIFSINYSFKENRQAQDDNNDSWCIECHVTSSDCQPAACIIDPYNPWRHDGPTYVRIRRIAAKTACTWVCRKRKGSTTEHQKTHNVTVDTLEDAENLMKQYKDKSNSWVARHLGFADRVAQRIHDFVAWQPAPVFFLEEGDLCITTNTEPHGCPEGFLGTNANFFARRKGSKSI